MSWSRSEGSLSEGTARILRKSGGTAGVEEGCRIVANEGLLYGAEPLFENSISEQFAANFDEGAHYINAHGHRALGIQDCGGHEGAVLGEHPRAIFPVLAAAL